MASDRPVTPRHVLDAVMELDRRGTTAVLAELEMLEPDLAGYLLEGLTRLYHRLTDLGLSGTDARRAHRRTVKTALVCLLALRRAYRGLVDEQAGPPESPPDGDPDPPP